jgi:hypothetical protein
VNLWVALIPYHQSVKAVQPRQRSFDHPTMSPKAFARFDADARDAWLNTSPSQRKTICARRVSLIGVELLRTSTWATDPSTNRTNMIHYRDQHDDIRHVRGRQHRACQRSSPSVGDEVMLRAKFGSIGRVRPRLPAPLLRPRLRRVDDCARPIELSGSMKTHKQDLEDLLKDPSVLPFPKSIPTGLPATTQFLRHILPRDAGAQNEHYACKGSPVGSTWSPTCRRSPGSAAM